MKMNIACFSSTPGLCPWFSLIPRHCVISSFVTFPIVKECSEAKEREKEA